MKLYHTVSIHTLYATTACNRFEFILFILLQKKLFNFCERLEGLTLLQKIYYISDNTCMDCKFGVWTLTVYSWFQVTSEAVLGIQDKTNWSPIQMKRVITTGAWYLSIQVWVLTFCLLAGRWVGLSLLYLLSSLSVKCIREWCWKTNRHTCNGQSSHQNQKISKMFTDSSQINYIYRHIIRIYITADNDKNQTHPLSP